MATFPTVIDTFVSPNPTDKLNNPSHSTLHNSENTALSALETKVGVDSSAVNTSLDYKVKNTASIDPGHHHTTSTLDSLASSKLTGQVAIANGGTGQSTQQTAIDALLPSQTGKLGQFLTSDGSTSSWSSAGGRESRGTLSNITALVSTTTPGTNRDTVVTHNLSTTPTLIQLTCGVNAKGNGSNETKYFLAWFDSSSANAVSRIVMSNSFAITALGPGTLEASGTGGGGGGDNATKVTVTIINIGATTFTLRCNCILLTGTDQSNSSVDTLSWLAIG